MERSSIVVLEVFVVLAVFFSFQPTVVEGRFMDMYGKLFQAELLDDCSVYIYDRVIHVGTRKNWCKLPKSSMNADLVKILDENAHDFNEIYAVVFALYKDDDGYVYMEVSHTKGTKYKLTLFSQDYFEAKEAKNYYRVEKENEPREKVPHTNSEYGRYYVDSYAKGKNQQNEDVLAQAEIVFEACKYGKTSGPGMAQSVNYSYKRTTTVKKLESCDSKVVMKQTLMNRQMTVKVNPQNPKEFICTVDDQEFLFRPIKQSIQTGAVAYDMIQNFDKSFPERYSKQISNYAPNYEGAQNENNGIRFNEKFYNRPTMNESYTEQPFCFYNENEKKYSPLFLYYKYKGENRTFTVRFVYDEGYYNIFDEMEYMAECEFPTDDFVTTVAAAPRVVSYAEEWIFIEVYFLINNAEFQFCIYNLNFTYTTHKADINLIKTSEINAYVHVKQRTTTAANCDFGSRTVRWLLAYSQKGSKHSANDANSAELISLDNDVSSPIFPCSHCGPDSKMYCDVSPNANEYHSAVFILTAGKNKTDITYVRVIQSKGYEKRIEYHDFKLDGEFYFLQNMQMKLELKEIHARLYEGFLNAPFIEDNSEPDEFEERNWLDSMGNSGFAYWWLTLFACFLLNI